MGAAAERIWRMELRKLNPKEHGNTRPLWEQIFDEDTRRFLDYYYGVKAAENEIFVMEEDDKPRAMLQLNPYRVHLGSRTASANYIVGVATDPDYRHQGLMRRLLHGSLCAMYEREEPFTFLMPAAEAIYYPFGFRFIYDQVQGSLDIPEGVKGKVRAASLPEEEERVEFRSMESGDVAELVRFSERVLGERYRIYTVRDSHYYEVLKKEQLSENGDVILLFGAGEICGWFSYGIEGGAELREIVLDKGAEAVFFRALSVLFGGKFASGKALGVSPDEILPSENRKRVPVIMARIIHLAAFLECFTASEPVSLCIEVRDEILNGNNGVFLWELTKENSKVTRLRETEGEAEFSFDIGELTQLLFGYRKVFPEEKGSKKLNCIHFYDKVFLNEIV